MGSIYSISGVKWNQTMKGKMKRGCTNQHPFQRLRFLKFCCSYHQGDEVWLSYSIGSFRYLLKIFHMQHSIFPGGVLLSQESWDPMAPQVRIMISISQNLRTTELLLFMEIYEVMRNRGTTNKMWNSHSCNHTNVLIISRFCFCWEEKSSIRIEEVRKTKLQRKYNTEIQYHWQSKTDTSGKALTKKSTIRMARKLSYHNKCFQRVVLEDSQIQFYPHTPKTSKQFNFQALVIIDSKSPP